MHRRISDTGHVYLLVRNNLSSSLQRRHIFTPVRYKLLLVAQFVGLAKDPKQRFASVQAFARALELAAQSAEPTVLVSRPDSSPVPVMAQPSSQTQLEEIPMPVSASREPEASPTPAPTSREPEASPTPSLAPTLPEDPPAPLPSPPKESGEQILKPQPGAPAHVASPGSAWSFGNNQQIWAMIVGIALFGFVSYLLDLFFLAASNDGYSSPQYQTFWLVVGVAGFSLMNIALGLSLIIPGFFAARFGPWVGFATATFGNLLGNALSGTLSAPFNPWYTSITYAIFGFIAGLAFVRTHGRYTTRGALLSLAVINVIGLVTSLGWQILGDSSFNPPAPLASFYLPMALIFCLPGLLLLSSLLIVYEKVVPHKN